MNVSTASLMIKWKAYALKAASYFYYNFGAMLPHSTAA